MTRNEVIEGIKQLLLFLGEDPAREGLLRTPIRVVKAFEEMTSGYDEDPEKILSAQFNIKYDEMVVLDKIDFVSLCEHHMLPFIGNVSIGYLPRDRVVGISKLARLVECLSRRLQIQERLTQEIAEAINKALNPRGVGVVVRASHSCMGCRGIKKPGAIMLTSSILNDFRNHDVRQEFFNLIK